MSYSSTLNMCPPAAMGTDARAPVVAPRRDVRPDGLAASLSDLEDRVGTLCAVIDELDKTLAPVMTPVPPSNQLGPLTAGELPRPALSVVGERIRESADRILRMTDTVKVMTGRLNM